MIKKILGGAPNKAAVALLDKEEITDLAKLFACEVRRVNQQVKGNIDRFRQDFMFQLTIEEAKNLPRSQFVTLEGKGANIKYLMNRELISYQLC